VFLTELFVLAEYLFRRTPNPKNFFSIVSSKNSILEENMEKRLYRSRKEKMISGVASGLGFYLNIDPVILRIIFVILTLINGTGLIIYLVMWAIVPQEPYELSFSSPNPGESAFTNENKGEQKTEEDSKFSGPAYSKPESKGHTVLGIFLNFVGSIFLIARLMPEFDFFDIMPVLLIIGGLGLIFANKLK